MTQLAEAGGDDELVAGTQVGEYVIERLLGAGGMGEVYGARHPVIGKRVAIKVMNRYCSANPSNIERFEQEAKAVNAIGHANIVDIFSYGKMTDGRCYFVMEWMQGKSLRDTIDEGGVTPARAFDVLEPVLRALEAAHATGIVHRDLKPDNIFLVAPRDGEPERIKLLDFGIAKLADDGTQVRNNRTKTGTVIGTPAYMAPEQASGAAITGQSDIYSLGVVAYEMATGTTPFDAESAVQIMAKHVDQPPPRPSSIRAVTSGLEQLILDMLAKAPSERPTPAQARERVARLRIDPGEVVERAPPAVTEAVKFVARAKQTAATTPALQPRRAAAAAVSAASAEIPAPSSRRVWLMVALLGGLGVAAIGVGASTTGSHGASAGSTGSANSALTQPAAAAAAAAPVTAPAAVAPPTPTPAAPTPVITQAPAIKPIQKIQHRTVTVKAAQIAAPAAPATPPPPAKRDVDAVVDPYAGSSSP